MITDVRTGRFTTSVLDLSATQHHRRSLPPVVFLHGVGGNGAQPLDPSQLGQGAVLRAVSALGYPIVVPTISSYWGNATGEARVNEAITWARANLNATNDPVILVGTSHGGGSALCYIANNPTLVACAVIMVPALDYTALRDGNIFNLRASIDAAWGVVYPTDLPAGSNPATRTADMAGKPIQMWTANNDTVSINHATFAAAAGMKVTSYDVGALGHSDAAVIAVDEATVTSFVLNNS